jgi:cytosine deaminase
MVGMFAQMTSTFLLRAATHQVDGDGRPSLAIVDVRIVDGVISEVGDLTPLTHETVEDLSGYVLLPAAVEPHAHLDKAFLAERITNETGDLMGAITAMQASRHLLNVDETIERAERAARLMASNGFHAVRSHADTTLAHGLRSIEALVEVQRRVADVIDVEIVALCGWPMTGPQCADQRALLNEAMSSGANLVGGVPHLEGQADREATEVLLQIATDHGVGIDLHTDETTDADVLGVVDLAELVLDGFEYPVTASHCVSLGMQSLARQQEVAELIARAGISVIALPHTNLFLQGRGMAPMPRALTAVEALMTAGVTVAAGADNLQDPFNPVGRACPFETAGLMMMAAHLLPHDAWASVSTQSARATGQSVVTIAPGSPAHLVAARSDTVREAIAFGPADRMVWRSGTRVGRDH